MKPGKLKYKILYSAMISLLAAFWISYAPLAISQDNTVDHFDINFCNASNNAFTDGEEVTYRMYYQLNLLWLPAGEVTFKVEELEDAYKVTAIGKTISAFEWFYKVHDYYESIIDKETLLPLEFTRDIKEGKYHFYNKFIFDQENKKVISHEGRSKDKLKTTEIELSDCMHDMMSIVYFMRNVDYSNVEAGESFPIKVFVEEEYPLGVQLRQKEKIKKVKGSGKYVTNMLSPEVIEGYFFGKNTKDMKIWVSADENQIPLMIETPVSVGKIKAVIKDYKNLKYSLTSKRFY